MLVLHTNSCVFSRVHTLDHIMVVEVRMGLQKDPRFLYYVKRARLPGNVDVWRVPRKGLRGSKQIVVKNVPLVMHSDYLYYIDRQGHLASTRRINANGAPARRLKATAIMATSGVVRKGPRNLPRRPAPRSGL